MTYNKFETAYGGTIHITKAPEHMQPGYMLHIGVADDGDNRHVEIFLSPRDLAELKWILNDPDLE